MSEKTKDFQLFLKERDAIASAYVVGDVQPLEKVLTTSSSATFFGPGGGFVDGAEAVASNYAKGAASFEAGGTSRLEILQSGSSDDLAYWTGFQRASVQLKDSEKPVDMDLRITEIFRREGSEWKLVHRHADMLVEEQKRG